MFILGLLVVKFILLCYSPSTISKEWGHKNIICGIQCKMKMRDPLIKSYVEFQGGNSRTESKYVLFWVARSHVHGIGPNLAKILAFSGRENKCQGKAEWGEGVGWNWWCRYRWWSRRLVLEPTFLLLFFSPCYSSMGFCLLGTEWWRVGLSFSVYGLRRPKRTAGGVCHLHRSSE